MPSNAAALGTVAVVGIYATFALDCYSTFCSSPQTTELNAKARSGTLMKWVGIGGAVAVAGSVGASAYSGSAAPFIGASVITVIMYACYVHARNSGLKSNAPPTENYSTGAADSGSGNYY